MTHADAIPTVDEVLAGKYRVQRVLGQGGMGIVLGALHLTLDERVAIKFLLPELAHDPALVARFLREGRAAIKIRSEHVVRVLDVATLPGGTPYMVMEHLEGKNLEELLEQEGRLPSEIAVDHVLQATEAIAEAHALGMVHRDLKPANLFLVHRADGSPSVKVLDFGITKVVETKDGIQFDATNTSIVMGSPRYMSPEQMRSNRTIDARADIWALGVILQELITGDAPFNGTTMPDLVAAILQDPPPLLRAARPDAPEGLEQIIARCLAKDPAARYRDVAELAAALAPFGSQTARLSADRVSRVIHPRAPIDTSTSAPIVRNMLGSSAAARTSSAFKPEPPSIATVTVSATGSGRPGRPARSVGRTVTYAAAATFFAATLGTAMFSGGPRRGAGHPGAPTNAAASVGPPLAPESESFPTVDLVPALSPADPVPAEVPTASAKPPTAAPAKHRTRPAPSPTADSPANEDDLFDGRK